MSKNSDPYHNRLDELFADAEAALPEPDESTPPPAPVEETLASAESPAPADPPLLDTLTIQSEDAPAQSKLGFGWEDYLNAIDRQEKIGFRFDSTEVTPIQTGIDPDGQKDGDVEVPLQIGGQILGSLQLEGVDGWSEEETDLLNSIAQQVAQHVENLRLLEQAEQYRSEAEEATRRLTREGWEEYIQTPAAPAIGYTYDHNRVRPLESVEDISLPPKAALDATTITHDLRIREETIGRLAVMETQEDPSTAASLLGTIAERLSTQIESLRLLEETERGRQQLDKRAAELETVAQVSTAAATILDPGSLLQSVVDLTRYSFNLYHAHVYLLQGTRLVLAAGAGKIGGQMLEDQHTLNLDQETSVIAKAARTREVVMVEDARTDPDFLYSDYLPDTLSELAVPMIVGDQLVGVFDVEADVPNRFTEEDRQTYMTLASQTAVALRNAELYAEQMATVERLKELDHLKSSFLANMSHELRTPLNSILGFTQVILEGIDGPLTDDMTNDLQLIDKNGQHLLRLINDVLDMAKIEAGRVSLTKELVNPIELLEDVLTTNSALAREKTLDLILESQLTEDLKILIDEVRIRQVLINLLGNAIKFTDQGSVTVFASRENNNIEVRIKDTGIGIPPDKLESIFEAFSQVDTSTTRKVGGTGLGLPISRRLVEVHGGRLWAESTGIPGEGSTFILELPIETVG